MSEKEPFSLHSWQKEAIKHLLDRPRFGILDMRPHIPPTFTPLILKVKQAAAREVVFINSGVKSQSPVEKEPLAPAFTNMHMFIDDVHFCDAKVNDPFMSATQRPPLNGVKKAKKTRMVIITIANAQNYV